MRISASKIVLTSALSLAISSVAQSGRADSTPSLGLSPAPAGDRSFALEQGGVHGHGLFSLRLFADYASDPLVLRTRSQGIDHVVAYQAWLHALVSLSLWHRLLVHASLPFILAESGDAPPSSGASAPRPDNGLQVGDLRVGARLRLFRSSDDPLARMELAVSSGAWIPTAGEGYGGDGAVRASGGLIADGLSRRLYWTFNGGVRTRPSHHLEGLLPTRVGTALTTGASAGFFADGGQKLALGTEVIFDLTIGAGAKLFDPRATVGHLLLTSHYRVKGGPLELGVAFGPGFGQGAGSEDFRVLAMVGFAPEQSAPRFDVDEDGIPDANDACVSLAGVPSGDPLLHGCPEAPADRDGDAIPDMHDACPTVAGEATGVRATHGCLAPVDSDGDGVPNQVDACPSERGEPLPGNGCPKSAEPPKAELLAQEVVISQQIQFETGTAVLRAESDAILSEVARVLREHPDVKHLEVQGHTDEQGTADVNRRLGEARAAAVVSWLFAHGVERNRLTAKGYGSDRPLAENTTEEGRRRNRRVEFHVTGKEPGPGTSEDGKRGGRR